MQSNKLSGNDLPSRHLLYLDGLRGMAALYVVLYHAYAAIMADRGSRSLSGLVEHLTNWLDYGQVAVDIFIVLSGYCLMLPVVRAGGLLRGGISQYLLRRARRILPPYYAALGLSLLLIVCVPSMQRFLENSPLSAFSPSVIVSHLLLIQNLNDNWIHTIDPPMWSVATEWQIYFLFPILLLPVWRRFGGVAAVLTGYGLGMALHFAFHRKHDFASPWFIGLFAMGMAAAAVNARSASSSKDALRWSLRACLFLLVIFVGAALTNATSFKDHTYVMDAVAGPATALFLIFCTEHCRSPKDQHPGVLKLLETPAALWLGAFSYSCYLVHYPVLFLFYLWLHSLPLSFVFRTLIFVGGGVPLCLGCSYLFHLAFERRFMPSHPRQLKQAEEAAVTSPAP